LEESDKVFQKIWKKRKNKVKKNKFNGNVRIKS